MVVEGECQMRGDDDREGENFIDVVSLEIVVTRGKHDKELVSV